LVDGVVALLGFEVVAIGFTKAEKESTDKKSSSDGEEKFGGGFFD